MMINRKNKSIKANFILIILLSVFILSFSFFYPRIGLSNHGNFHFSLVFQILNGNIPPDNLCLAGVPINYPWLYNFLLAYAHKLLGLNLITLNQLLNLFLFIGFFVFIYKANKTVFKNETGTLISAILSVFGINLLAGLFFITEFPWNSDIFIEKPSILFNFLTPVGDTRYAAFFVKFLNVSAYPLGIFLISIYFYATVKLLEKTKFNLKTTIIPLGALFAASLLHPFSALFIYAILFPAFFLAVFLKNKTKKDLIFYSLLHFIVLLAAFPYLISISSGVSTFKIDPIKRDLFDIFLSYPIHFILLLFISLKLFKKLKTTLKDLNINELFLIFGAVFVTSAVFLFEFVDGNDYKFVLLLSIVLSPLLVMELRRYFGSNFLKKLYYLVSFLIVIKLVLIAVAYFSSDWAKQKWPYKTPVNYQELEKNTQARDIIVRKNDNLYDLKGSLLAKRRNYAADCPTHTDNYKFLQERLYLINNLSKENIKYIKGEFPESSIIIISDTKMRDFDDTQFYENNEYIYIYD